MCHCLPVRRSACMGRGSNVNNSVDILQIGSHYAMNAKSGFRKRATGGAKPKHPRDARQTPRMAPRDHVTRCLALAIIGFGLVTNYVKAADLNKPTGMRQDNSWE